MFDFYLVDVKNITSDVARSSFDESDLERLADLVLESKGIIKPLILKPIDVDEYTVIEGHFEYYVAVRAKEKNPRQGEMVNAFVISQKNEENISKQIEAFKEIQASNLGAKPNSKIRDTTDINLRLTNIELRFEKQINEIRLEKAKEKEQLEAEIKQLADKTKKQLEPLKAFNTLSSSNLTFMLKSAGITGKTANSIIEIIQSQREKTAFTSLVDVVERVKGLSEKRILSIIDSLAHTLFD